MVCVGAKGVMGAMGSRREWFGAIGGVVAGALLWLPLFGGIAAATEILPAPQTAPILVVSGGVAVTNQDGKAVLDLTFLQSLPQVDITTETPWTDGEVRFEG